VTRRYGVTVRDQLIEQPPFVLFGFVYSGTFPSLTASSCLLCSMIVAGMTDGSIFTLGCAAGAPGVYVCGCGVDVREHAGVSTNKYIGYVYRNAERS
jgi:hypothetical protein